MTPTTLRFGSHVAALDVLTGFGLLALPAPQRDVADPLPVSALSLHGAEWDGLMVELARLGWEPDEGDDGMPMNDGCLSDGRALIALYGREPVTTSPTMGERADARARCLAKLD
jgi:hypothetical protein